MRDTGGRAGAHSRQPRPVTRLARPPCLPEMLPVTFFPVDSTLRAVALALAALLAGCSSVDNLVADDKIDYRGTAKKTAGLEVPPDLTQLQKESRYATPSGPVSASTFQAGASAPATPTSTVATTTADVRLERVGGQRFLATAVPPDRVWPQVKAFWQERGLTLEVDDAAAGIMETEWAENRAKLPNDIIRNTIGKVFSALYSTGERDKFRTRVERTAQGSEIYISHRGMVEVYTNANKDSTIWQPRPADPELEAELLQRLMVKLGAPADAAKAATTTVAGTPAAAGTARARVLAGRPAATLQVDDGFDSAWRRVGLALDRNGFTVEDRDRGLGLYFVRLIDSAKTAKEEPGFFSRIFGSASSDRVAPVVYRIAVRGDGAGTLVSVLDAAGQPENGAAGQRIVALLLEDLR